MVAARGARWMAWKPRRKGGDDTVGARQEKEKEAETVTQAGETRERGDRRAEKAKEGKGEGEPE